jgi:hypothetical protein
LGLGVAGDLVFVDFGSMRLALVPDGLLTPEAACMVGMASRRGISLLSLDSFIGKLCSRTMKPGHKHR